MVILLAKELSSWQHLARPSQSKIAYVQGNESGLGLELQREVRLRQQRTKVNQSS